LTPASAIVGSGAFTLTVTGSNFVSGAVVNFNGSARTTTFVSATQVTAALLASDVASVGTAAVTVTNPSGGGTSNPLTFTISAVPLPPVATTLTPASVIVGSGALTLTVTGSNFVIGIVVNFNGSPRTTTFVSATQVTAAILASDVATVGTAPVTVTNPSGGGTSNALTFTIAAVPVPPVATTLAPASVTVGSGAFTLTVTGTNFVSGAVVNFSGSARTTTFVSATQVTAAILASDVATVGTAPVTVTNPSGGGGTSNALTFTIAAVVPSVATALTPSSVIAGSGAFTLTVTGTNFVNGAVVNFNGSPRTTTFVSTTQVTAAILASDVASVGTAPVTVTNPSGGGTSNALIFTISVKITYSGAAFTGTISAGTQAVSGSNVQLFAAGTTGNGSTPTALLIGALTTDTTGAFSVPAGYTCPTAASQLYVVARGGQLGTAAANSTIAFITSLGPCNQVVAASHVVLNEVTTVATVWAFSQFMAPGGKIGASATNIVGIANAAATAASLANPLTGTSPGPTFPSNGASPAAKINTLANILNTCTSSPSSSSSCSSLLSSSTGPALANQDMLDATLRIVSLPGANVAALFAQSTSQPAAFTPALTTAPSDWTLYVTFTGGGMNYPAGIGVDANGNLWVASYFFAGSTDPLAGSAAELSPIGKQLFPNGISGSGLSNVYGLAVDASNNAWLTNEASPGSVNGGLGSITVLSPSGQPLSGTTGYTASGIFYPIAVAIDTDSSAWILDYGNSHLTHLSNSGAPLSGTSGYTSNYFVFPAALAIDASHNVWVSNQEDVTVTKVSPNGQTFTNFSCCNGSSGLAIDQQGNVWISNYYGNSVSLISGTGAIVSNGTYTANGTLSSPQATAIDGAGNVWVGNFHAGYLTELAGASSTTPASGQPLSPAAGWAPDANLFGAYAIAIDPSGNLWVSNLYGASVTEFVGLAAPVKTPQLGPPQTP
jgi:sugar lactone lactonase YvrE